MDRSPDFYGWYYTVFMLIDKHLLGQKACIAVPRKSSYNTATSEWNNVERRV